MNLLKTTATTRRTQTETLQWLMKTSFTPYVSYEVQSYDVKEKKKKYSMQNTIEGKKKKLCISMSLHSFPY